MTFEIFFVEREQQDIKKDYRFTPKLIEIFEKNSLHFIPPGELNSNIKELIQDAVENPNITYVFNNNFGNIIFNPYYSEFLNLFRRVYDEKINNIKLPKSFYSVIKNNPNLKFFSNNYQNLY